MMREQCLLFQVCMVAHILNGWKPAFAPSACGGYPHFVLISPGAVPEDVDVENDVSI